MTVGNVNATAVAYQGSGLESSVGQKAAVTPKAAEVASVPVEGKAKVKPEVPVSNMGADQDILVTERPQNEAQTNEAIKRAVEQINKKANNSEAIFGIHDATNRVTIKIVDKQTKEVIKEFPPEETLDMIAKAWELAGLMVDEKG